MAGGLGGIHMLDVADTGSRGCFCKNAAGHGNDEGVDCTDAYMRKNDVARRRDS